MNASDRPAAGCRPWAAFRAVSTITIVVAVAGCSQPAHQDSIRESARYAAHAHRNYTAPGPAEDPWGPYIHEASERFDVPEIWVRSLMRVESGGREYVGDQLITSGAGAMGLMQVMPETYDELRDRYHLGDDPFDPHDNILSGVAYMREMYELYGTPGFLAAYNAGPARLDDYLSNTRPLPDETRRYVAMIAPNLVGVNPNNRSAGDQLAMNSLPINIPPGRRYGRPVMLASTNGGGGRMSKRGQVELAQRPEPLRHGSWGGQQFTLVMPPNAATATVTWRLSLVRFSQCRRGRAVSPRPGGNRPMGHPGRRLRQTRHGAWRSALCAGPCAGRTRRRAPVRRERASGPSPSMARADDRDVPRHGETGLPKAHTHAHRLHRVAA